MYKPAGVWCKEFKPGTGCGIHQLRPKQCREFQCLWLTEDWLTEAWKPSIAKFVMDWEYDHKCLSILCDPNQPNAWKREPYYTVLKALAQRHLAENRIVMIVEPTRRLLMLPDQEVVLGGREELFSWEVKNIGTEQAPHFDVIFDRVAA